jgi:hypothetical protein
MSEQRATVGFILLASVIVSLIVLQGVRANPEPTPTPTAEPRQTHAQNNPEPSRTKRAERVTRSTGRPQPAPVRVKGKAQRYAAGLVSETQMRCLVPLWQRESGWSATSDNPTSSAYGIPQILGLEKRTGDDYRAQVDAGLDYIAHRYGTPCRAWAFWQTHRWY